MKTTAPHSCLQRAGFTLIEMIGVLAIMAILAAVITPNALRSIERAAVRSEADTLHVLGEQTKLYLRDNGVAPTTANWNTVLASYASLSSTDLLYNPRQVPNGPITRLYVPDPVAANLRAMFISSMRNGIALPSVANISNNFAAIWNTPNGNVPVGPGWNTWNANNVEYLVVERVSLRPPIGSYSPADVQTEADTLRAMGGQIKLYLSAKGTTPPPNIWNQVLTLYGTLSPTDLLYNRCQIKPVNPNDPALIDPVLANQQGYITRLYVPDPVAANKRAVLISSMLPGATLPSIANISNFFTTIWNTPVGNVPVAAGWNSWNVNNVMFLVIERISFQPELQNLPSNLKCTVSPCSYRLVSADGTNILQAGNVTPGNSVDLIPDAHPNQRLMLYSAANWMNLNYSYVFTTTGKNFAFDGTNWLPQ